MWNERIMHFHLCIHYRMSHVEWMSLHMNESRGHMNSYEWVMRNSASRMHMTHSYEWHNSFTWVTHSYVWHDSIMWTYEWVMRNACIPCRINAHMKWLRLSLQWINALKNESCRTYQCHTYDWVMSHIRMSHSCEWVMSLIWICHVTHVNALCHSYEGDLLV